jgi:hypothetical protein
VRFVSTAGDMHKTHFQGPRGLSVQVHKHNSRADLGGRVSCDGDYRRRRCLCRNCNNFSRQHATGQTWINICGFLTGRGTELL